MIEPDYEFHVHTKWCRHAVGEIEDYIDKAIDLGLKTIAITDHMPYDNRFNRAMYECQFDEFNNLLDQAIIKYKDKINVIKGMECEYYPFMIDFYHKLRALDYKVLLLSNHNSRDLSIGYFHEVSDEDILLYEKEIIDSINTGLFDIVAHPDLFMSKRVEHSDLTRRVINNIFKACEANHMLVEINATPFRSKNRYYTNEETYEIASKYDLEFTIGSDAHDPEHLRCPAYYHALGIAEKYHLNVYKCK